MYKIISLLVSLFCLQNALFARSPAVEPQVGIESKFQVKTTTEQVKRFDFETTKNIAKKNKSVSETGQNQKWINSWFPKTTEQTLQNAGELSENLSLTILLLLLPIAFFSLMRLRLKQQSKRSHLYTLMDKNMNDTESSLRIISKDSDSDSNEDSEDNDFNFPKAS